MKLFIDCRMLGSGGIGTYLESLLPYFTKNNDCILLCSQNQAEKLLAYKDKSEILYTDIKTFSIKELLFFPKDLCKRINECDLYYSPYCNVPSGIRIPVFTTIHDIVFLDVPGLSSKTGTFARKFFYQNAVNRSKAVFTVSQFSADRIKQKLKPKNTPLVVTYNSVPEWFINDDGTDTNTKNTEGATDVSAPDSAPKDNSIIFVGNIKKHKGLSTLLEAFTICKKQGLDARLVIIGNAENFRSGDEETVIKLAELQDKDITFTGKISDSELKAFYKKARLLVQPSLYEGFGMPPMEALISGTNVILSDIKVFKEIYKDFPVTFFKTQDAQDLAQKITANFNVPAPSKASIPDKYSFQKTSDIITETFRRFI
ncbi:MAG: glycosyltransferase family 4 protein [Treponema sp.]|nr:glycosyltransferase family 4 protein [Treponema sp.]